MRPMFGMTALVLLALEAWAATPRKCAVCEAPLTAQFYWASAPTLLEKLPVCEPCSKLDTICSICRLPVRKNYETLNDGRLLCQKDYVTAVFKTAEALRIFQEAKRDAQRFLHGYGELPDRNISVSLVNSNELGRMDITLPSWHGTLLGLTRTRRLAGQYEHHIFLLNGLTPARLTSISAHEYAHAWMHENIPATRKLDPNAVEGFCELVAYKVAVEREDPIEKQIILANAYTRGQISAFVQGENEHQFHRIVHWMKTGADELLAQTNSPRILTLREDRPAAPLWPPPPVVQTQVPDTLLLKGISGSAHRRFALINDCTLVKNEVGRVRVGTSNVMVRCLEIKARSAVIELLGSDTSLELVLAGY